MLTRLGRLALAISLVTALGCVQQQPRDANGGGGGGATRGPSAPASRDTGIAPDRVGHDALPDGTMTEIGGGGGPDGRTPTPTPSASPVDQLGLSWGTGLTGDRRRMAEAYARAAWVQAHLAVGDWEQAATELDALSDNLEVLDRSRDIPAPDRTRLSAMAPQIALLATHIANHDSRALTTASDLTARLNTEMVALGRSNWAGGGAGRGNAP